MSDKEKQVAAILADAMSKQAATFTELALIMRDTFEQCKKTAVAAEGLREKLVRFLKEDTT